MSEYIPKVNDKCEWKPYSPTNASWKTCTVDFIHGECFCITNTNSFKEKQVVNNVKFRPIKTDDVKAIDAIEQLITDHYLRVSTFPTGLAKALHDADYHNQKKVKPLDIDKWLSDAGYSKYGRTAKTLNELSDKGHIIEAKEDE